MRQKQIKKELNHKTAGGQNDTSAPAQGALGLNDNMSFMGRILHIQTEKIGRPPGRIVTQVFYNGRVLFSTRSEFPSGMSLEQDFKKIQELMQEQHLRIIDKIRNKKREILEQC